jgi:N-acetylmuramoyl-L-alanine amidase
MKVVNAFLTVNQFSRPGHALRTVKGIVMHYLGVPGQTAWQCQQYFESLKTQDAADNVPDRSASAHFIIDHDGTILAVVPLTEKAYHCGSTVYTDKAVEVFGDYARFPDKTSPNSCSIGIEMCHGAGGAFTDETIKAATELAASLCFEYRLSPQHNILTHNEVVGWKSCPEYWVKRPALFAAFKYDVLRRLEQKYRNRGGD